MKISVITVVRNREATIATALDSVASQTWPDIEHIVVDGASTDGTLAILRQPERKFAKLISEADDGIYDALNKGVSSASGDVIAFLHADDVYAHSRVLENVAQSMAVGALDALMGDVAFFRSESPDRLVRRYRSGRFRPDRLGWGWMPAHPALFVRRDVFVRFGLFRTDYRIAGDFEWITRAFGGNRLCYRHVSEVLVKMRMGGTSTAGWRSTVLLNQEMMRACRENGIATNWIKLLSKYPAKIWEFVRR